VCSGSKKFFGSFFQKRTASFVLSFIVAIAPLVGANAKRTLMSTFAASDSVGRGRDAQRYRPGTLRLFQKADVRIIIVSR
jgi:hypothetical protein